MEKDKNHLMQRGLQYQKFTASSSNSKMSSQEEKDVRNSLDSFIGSIDHHPHNESIKLIRDRSTNIKNCVHLVQRLVKFRKFCDRQKRIHKKFKTPSMNCGKVRVVALVFESF